MNSIVEDKAKTFKDLEQEIFRIACELAVEVTQEILKNKDNEIFVNRDKEKYKSEGLRKTSIKTIYGSVEYHRRVYATHLEDGKKAYVYLLDEALGMDNIGLISENLAEKIADIATEAPYRETANEITSTTGMSISAQGAWNLMQQVGERIGEEEDHAVNQMHTGNTAVADIDTSRPSVSATVVGYIQADAVIAADRSVVDSTSVREIDTSTLGGSGIVIDDAGGRERRVLAGFLPAFGPRVLSRYMGYHQTAAASRSAVGDMAMTDGTVLVDADAASVSLVNTHTRSLTGLDEAELDYSASVRIYTASA